MTHLLVCKQLSNACMWSYEKQALDEVSALRLAEQLADPKKMTTVQICSSWWTGQGPQVAIAQEGNAATPVTVSTIANAARQLLTSGSG